MSRCGRIVCIHQLSEPLDDLDISFRHRQSRVSHWAVVDGHRFGLDCDALYVGDREDFLSWVRTALYEAEVALHNGDPAPRRALWSRNEPVSVLGAWRNAHGQSEL